MIWGVGTGRCGTKSLAVQLGGEHEPKPWLKYMPAYYARGIINHDDNQELIEALKDRAQHNTPIIVDLKHSYVMDIIEAIDPDACFIYMVRNPFDCIASFMLGGAYTDQDWNGNRKIQPPEGWPSNQAVPRLFKVTWMWREVNKRICDHLSGTNRNYAVRYTTELTERQNIYRNRNFEFDRIDATQVMDATHESWARAVQLHIEQKDDWLKERGIYV